MRKRVNTGYALTAFMLIGAALFHLSPGAGSAQRQSDQDQTKKRDLGLGAASDVGLNGLSSKSSALVIGISKYQNLPAKAQLNFAAADAEGLRDFLISEKGGFKPANVTLLVNQTATRDRIVRELEKLQNSSGPNDLVLIFFAGHGVVNPSSQGFLLASDSQVDDLSVTSVAMDTFNGTVRKMRARSVVIITDACHSASISESLGSVTNVTHRVFAEASSREDQSTFIFSAASPVQSSLEPQELRHGLFTYYLLKGLEGEADRDKDGLVRSKEIYDYTAFQVREWAKQQGYDQIPEYNPFYDRSIPLAILNEAGQAVYQQWIETDPVVSYVSNMFREALSEGKLTKPEKESAWSFYNRLVEYRRSPPDLVEQTRNELLSRLTTAAQAVIDRSPTDPVEWDQASEWFGTADELAPDKTRRAKRFYCAGRARFYSGDLGRAENEWDTALTIIEQNRLNEPFLCLYIARFYKDLGQETRNKSHWGKARRAYRLALAVEANPRVEWLSESAEVLIQLGDWVEAENLLRQARTLDPDDPQALKLLAKVLLQSDERKKVSEAEEVAAHAYKVAPEDIEIEEVYGEALLKAEKPALAVGPLRHVARQRWSDPKTDPKRREDAFSHLSRAYARSGDLGRAISALREAERLGSPSVELYDALGHLLIEQGDLDGAIAAAEKAVKLIAGNEPEKKAQHLRTLAEYLERTGQLEPAASKYQEAAANLRPIDARLSNLLDRHAEVLFYRAGQPQMVRTRAMISRSSVPADRSALPKSPVIVPGGLEALERLSGVHIESSRDSRALAEIFDACLRDSSVRTRLNNFYGMYPEFIKLVGPSGGGMGVPVSLNPSSKEHLKFFGLRQKGGRIDVEQAKFDSRKVLLEALGGDPEKLKRGEPISVTLRKEELPVLFGIEQWVGKLKDGPKLKPEEQLLALLKSQPVMQLYAGLSMLPEEAAWWTFISVLTKENSEDLPAGIYLAAPFLRITADNRLHIPGQRQGELNWRRVLKAPTSTGVLQELFMRKNGGALYLFAALSAAGEVGDKLAQSSYFDQLNRLFQTAPLPPAREPFDLIDLFSMMKIEGNQVRLPKAAETWLRPQASGDLISALLSKVGGVGSSPVVKQIAVLAHIERERPDWVSNPKTVDLILKQIGARREPQLELALDLRMNEHQLEQYFLAVDRLEAISTPEPKRLAIRVFQSAFELLRLLARNGALTESKVGEMAGRFLKLDPSSDRFAFDVLATIKSDLLGLQPSASGEEVENKLLAALAGGQPLVVLKRTTNDQTSDHSTPGSDGMTFYQFDSPSATRDQVTQALQSQTHTRLATVALAVTALDELEKNPSQPVALHQLQAGLGGFVEPEPPPLSEKEKKKKKSNRQVDTTPSLKQLAAQLAPPISPSTLMDVRRQVTPYVGEALLGVVYAAMLDAGGDLGSASRDLVRNHDFGADPWGDTVFDAGKMAVRGSVARLSSALAQLEARVSPGSRGSAASLIAPTTWPVVAATLNSYRLVDHREVTPRAAEYVARSIDLGEDVLALSSLNDPSARTVIEKLEEILTPRRATAVRALLDQGEIKKAIRELTLSELYYLGQRYFIIVKLAEGSASNLTSEPGALDVLFKLVGKGKVAEAGREGPESLERELRQFGMTMTTRSGLARLDLIGLEPYEQALSFREPHRLAERLLDLKFAVARACYRRGCSAALPLSTMLGRDTLQRTIVESKKATGGTPPPERDWEDMVLAMQAMDEQNLGLFLTTFTQSRYSRGVPGVKWSDETVPGTEAAVKSK